MLFEYVLQRLFKIKPGCVSLNRCPQNVTGGRERGLFSPHSIITIDVSLAGLPQV